MRWFLVAFAVCAAGSTYAADDTVMRAMKLYEKRHYEEASGLLRSAPAAADAAKQGIVNLTLGMAYFKNAVLHRELAQSAAEATQDYLKRLSADQGASRSRFADLYLGEALLEAGKPGAAAIYLEKISANEGMEPRHRNIAKAGLGLSYHRNNEMPRADALWAAIDTTDFEVRAELAAAYCKAGIADKNVEGMAEKSLAEARKSGKPLSMRLLKNLLAVYTRAGSVEKGLDLLRRSDLKDYSYREVLGKTKVINFYDLSLLGDLAALYGRASVLFLEKAAADPQGNDMAAFTLGQAYALFGPAERSAKTMTSFIATSSMPSQYKDRIRVWQAAGLYQKNRQSEAMNIWSDLARKQPEDPDLLAEMLQNCSRLKIDCAPMVLKSTASVESGEGRRFGTLNSALGKYYLRKHENAKAVMYLEAGRDKSNKNKIESNEPATLVNLAEAYFRTKKYSEALEIYFEMSKQFPEVRQIQEAMQGVYAMEHKSAGDVKIN